MVETVILDKKEILTCATFLQGEYGISNTVIGVPVKLGRSGIEQIIELDLTPDEKIDLNNSAQAVKEQVKSMRLSEPDAK